MDVQQHQGLIDKIWAVANKLRGPYRPPQYRKVMLPLSAQLYGFASDFYWFISTHGPPLVLGSERVLLLLWPQERGEDMARQMGHPM